VVTTPTTAGTRTYFLLLDVPAPGTAFLSAEGAGDVVALSLYLYLYGDGARELTDVWSPFLAGFATRLTPTA
jgi:hypothetical protein